MKAGVLYFILASISMIIIVISVNCVALFSFCVALFTFLVESIKQRLFFDKFSCLSAVVR